MGGLNGLTGGAGGGGGEDEGAMWVVKNLLKLNQGPQGSDKFAFPIMRQQLKNKFCAERLILTGTNGNTIDALMVPCQAQYEKMTREKKEKAARKLERSKNNSNGNGNGNGNGINDDDDDDDLVSGGGSNSNTSGSGSGSGSGSFSPSPLGCVMFCSPNAGLYELLSQVSCQWQQHIPSFLFNPPSEPLPSSNLSSPF